MNGFDLKIQPGEFILLVGKSGSGKSTLIQLLLRLYDPSQGSISFNDIDLKEFKLSSLRNRIGYVSQEPLLLPLNIEQNIAFGEEIINEDRLISALKESNSLEFIRGLKRGVKTIISEDGKGLSGGQKQRIALARALYRDPALLLLDEPTSALDRESEKEIVEAIRKLKRNKTIILCTHKAEAFDFADRVIEIADGKTLEKN